MRFNRFLTRKQIVDQYSVPREMEATLFASLQPAFGAGNDAKYLESQVDAHIHSSLATHHPPQAASESSRKKESGVGQHWADTVETGEGEQVPVADVLLVDEKRAALLLGVSRRAVFELNKKGLLTAKRIGQRKLYAVSHLRAFAEGQVA